MFLKSLAAGMTAAALALAATFGVAQAQQKSTVDEIRDRGVLRIAGILNEDPYFSKDPRTGEWRGFVVEMGKNMAEELGVKLEVVESSWSNSILDVQSGKVDLAFALTALPKRALAVHFSAPTYYNSFTIISPKAELASKTWAELNDPAYTIAVDLGSSQDQITRAYLPKANILRFKTRDEAVLAVATGKADAIINTVFNSMVMTKKNAAIGKVYVPQPILSSPSVVGMNQNADDVWRGFVSAWADYNRRVGNNQTWILMGLEPFGIGLDDLPEGFDING
ncbi:amino acid ABC transporter substrate-binding protein, PAAT family [Gemmobacter megaterium]|uniref:Amino acid ABC transporter substrate-binding protein, PAAT family n=1 Tax=Gemmobacter megaterium TaxID=1086013 RepID=A0A1N7PWX9_9RHOB|nr:transporter substrate-binding domain-containing protein [Gemmobacter megaterium]GGE21826.1 ABC transporter substrate-binding protein [Gemmobacter megaterium]SIT14939.1 amino acid ABC transporter substrate-binding protein, PAAT family [Gemmobacter megaterium]